LLVTLCEGPLRRAFWLGLLTGGIYFTGTLYWITRVMVVYGGVPTALAVPINAALVAYLALFPALFALIVRRLIAAYGLNALIAAPFVWIATEFGREHLLTGFPWVLLGYSQTSVLQVAQLASVVGVYGVSLLVAAVSAALALAVRRRYVPIATMLTVVLAVVVWGRQRVEHADLTHAGQPIRVGMIQGNVDQGVKWDPTRAASIFEDYVRMTRQAIGEGAQLLLWPESSTPFMYEEDPVGAARIRALVQQAHVSLLFGSDQIEWKTIGNQRVPDKYFNSAFLLRPDGTTAGVYRKMHLVPFGEYVPLQQLLFFAAPLTEQVGTFWPGESPQLLPVNGHPTSVAICYEVVYPSLVREFVRGGAELLTTITNDAWFGSTSAPYQHFQQASMRAIENGRYLVRAANTGISGIVDPYGRVVDQSAIFQPAVLVGEARFLTEMTIYARYGDVAPYASLLLTVVLLAASRRRVR
jgi:apolipoprotein N-acyltransferase